MEHSVALKEMLFQQKEKGRRRSIGVLESAEMRSKLLEAHWGVLPPSYWYLQRMGARGEGERDQLCSGHLTDLHRKHQAWEPNREPHPVPAI